MLRPYEQQTSTTLVTTLLAPTDSPTRLGVSTFYPPARATSRELGEIVVIMALDMDNKRYRTPPRPRGLARIPRRQWGRKRAALESIMAAARLPGLRTPPTPGDYTPKSPTLPGLPSPILRDHGDRPGVVSTPPPLVSPASPAVLPDDDDEDDLWGGDFAPLVIDEGPRGSDRQEDNDDQETIGYGMEEDMEEEEEDKSLPLMDTAFIGDGPLGECLHRQPCFLKLPFLSKDSMRFQV